jgi:DNA (cytosine-5)-methyltransferase 1
MRLLDLFCCEGGAAVGYARAGFDVVGVDIERRPRYPFAFVQADAMAVLAGEVPGVHPDAFDVIHASPPCQAYSQGGASRQGGRMEHPDLLDPVRQELKRIGKPYVLENVETAPMQADLLLCGTMFGLPLVKHRRFESNVDLGWPPAAHACRGQAVRGHLLNVHNTAQRRLWQERHGIASGADALRLANGMPWASEFGCREGIPPAYTEFIGSRLLEA